MHCHFKSTNQPKVNITKLIIINCKYITIDKKQSGWIDHKTFNSIFKPFVFLNQNQFQLQLDSKQITNVAKGEDVKTLLKDCCVKDTVMQNVSSLVTVNATVMSTVVEVNQTEWGLEKVKVCVEKCKFKYKFWGGIL